MLSEDEEDGDEQFIVEEAVPSASDAPEVEVVSDSNSELFKYHGIISDRYLTSSLSFFSFQGKELDSQGKHGTWSYLLYFSF